MEKAIVFLVYGYTYKSPARVATKKPAKAPNTFVPIRMNITAKKYFSAGHYQFGERGFAKHFGSLEVEFCKGARSGDKYYAGD